MGEFGWPSGFNTQLEESRHLPTSSRELQSLANSGDYVLYSDDALLRMWILEERVGANGMCTLDLLCSLEELGLLTTEKVATKLAQLCDWHVGVQIQLRHHLALVPQSVRVASRVAEAASLLRGVQPFMSIAGAIWGLRKEFMDALNHVGSVLRILVQDPAVPDVGIAAYVAVWIDHATARPNMPLPALRLAAQVTLHAVAVDKLPIAAVRRLWNIYFGLVEALQAAREPKDYAIALALVAREAGALDKLAAHEGAALTSSFGERLMMGFDPGSDAWVAYARAYLMGIR